MKQFNVVAVVPILLIFNHKGNLLFIERDSHLIKLCKFKILINKMYVILEQIKCTFFTILNLVLKLLAHNKLFL